MLFWSLELLGYIICGSIRCVSFKKMGKGTLQVNYWYSWTRANWNGRRGVDFHKEAAKMCDVYRNATLTIAASCSSGDRAGFLQARTASEPERLKKPPRLQSLRFREAIDHRMHHEDPIHARGWTFQETILPRRLLSFGSFEMTWECETLRGCECGAQAMESSDEKGRAAYRKYTKAIINGQYYIGKKHDLPGVSARDQEEKAALSQHPDAGYDPHLISASPPELQVAKLLVDAAPDKDQTAYRAYIDNVRLNWSRFARKLNIPTELNKPTVFSAFFDGYLDDTPEPQMQQILSGESRAELVVSDADHGSVYAEWLEDHFLNRLSLQTFYRYWRRTLVPEYTRRALSNDGDKLIALQAIATDIQSRIRDKYLAGLWQGDLLRQLCWKSKLGQGLPALNESPSWSWSSVRGPIVPYLGENVEEFEEPLDPWMETNPMHRDMDILTANCSLGSSNPCGRIIGGSVTLRASAAEASCFQNHDTGQFEFRIHSWTLKGALPLDSVRLELNFRPDTPLGCTPEQVMFRCTQDDALNTRNHNHAGRVILLLVRVWDAQNISVLVCTSMSGESNTCCRLGIGNFGWLDLEQFSSYAVSGVFELV